MSAPVIYFDWTHFAFGREHHGFGKGKPIYQRIGWLRVLVGRAEK